MFLKIDLRYFGPFGKFQDTREISSQTARVSRLSISYGYDLVNSSRYFLFDFSLLQRNTACKCILQRKPMRKYKQRQIHFTHNISNTFSLASDADDAESVFFNAELIFFFRTNSFLIFRSFISTFLIFFKTKTLFL